MSASCPSTPYAAADSGAYLAMSSSSGCAFALLCSIHSGTAACAVAPNARQTTATALHTSFCIETFPSGSFKTARCAVPGAYDDRHRHTCATVRRDARPVASLAFEPRRKRGVVDARGRAKYFGRTTGRGSVGLMRQLSGTDSLFLRMERGNQYMHVAGLGIYDPSTAPEGKVRFKDVLNFFQTRLEALPVFRRRLVSAPFDLDRPYWIEEPDIDVEFHVRHIALPAPGDWRQLCIQVARIHARPLDRSKPLWEAYVIEGLDQIEGLPRGSFALYFKVHHCAVDGEAGTELLKAIHSLTAEDFSEPVAAQTRYRDREPSHGRTLCACVRA